MELDVLAYDENDDVFEDIVVDDRAELSGQMGPNGWRGW